MKKLILHCQQWNRWRKQNENSKVHQILVLLKIIHSPTFEIMKIVERSNLELASVLGRFTTSLDEASKAFAQFGEVIATYREEEG